MDKSKQDEGTLAVLVHGLNTAQLPRAQRMLERLGPYRAQSKVQGPRHALRGTLHDHNRKSAGE